jgi:SH3-like domain-containing protein
MASYRSIFISLGLLMILCLPLHVKAEEMMSVQVKESQVRSTPSFLGKIVARVLYGDRVSVTEKNGSWKKVSIKGSGTQGWIHESALTTKRIVLQSGQTTAQTSATQNELALAGKGFNDQVEASYMNKNKKLDYAWINKMEAFNVTPDLINSFLAKGEVVPPAEGGAK